MFDSPVEILLGLAILAVIGWVVIYTIRKEKRRR